VNPFTPKVLAVLRREFMQRVKTRWFLFSTIGIPLLMVGLFVLVGVFIVSSENQEQTVSVGVIDASGQVADFLVEELLADSVLATRARDLEGASEEQVRQALATSDYDTYLLLPADVLDNEDGQARMFATDNILSSTESKVRNALRRGLLRARLARSGMADVNADALMQTVRFDVVNVSGTGEARSQDIFQGISFGIAFLFYMVLLIYGQMIIRSIIEEKTSDIVEIMISSLRPWELMLGKIVGVGAVGLAQIAVWVVILTVATLYGLTGGAAQLAELGIDVTSIAVPWGTVALVLTFLVLGYLLYAGMFAGAGATISNETDAQQVAMPVTLLIIIPFMATQGAIGSPNAAWAVAMSIVPFFSPLVMPARLFVTSVPLWQTASSVLLLAIFVLGAAWVAGRIYRVGILMKGQRANLPEVVRWIRHG